MLKPIPTQPLTPSFQPFREPVPVVWANYSYSKTPIRMHIYMLTSARLSLSPANTQESRPSTAHQGLCCV